MKPTFDEITQPIIDIYSQIELDLMLEIAGRFAKYDTVAGSLEWQIEKLAEMGALNAAVVKKISEYSGVAESAIETMLKAASLLNIESDAAKKAYEEGVISVAPNALFKSPVFSDTITKSFVSLKDTFRLINTGAVEGCKKAYMDVLNRAYIETSSGIYGYNTAISRALQNMADNGIECATYKRGNQVVRYSIESCVRRDVLTAANQLANKVAFENTVFLDTEYVYVSKHIGARVSEKNKIANHAGWQGKVYKISGADEYPNLREETGYPDEIEGLGGVNCRHRIFTYFPGITVLPNDEIDEDENKQVYEILQKQRRRERGIRKVKKKLAVAEASGDKENIEKLSARLINKQASLDEFCENYGLKRMYERENVYFNSKKVKIPADTEKKTTESVENGEENDIIKKDVLSRITANEWQDKKQFEKYKSLLGSEAPQALRKFRIIKYNNDVSAWNGLKHKYRIVNQYKIDSGYIPISEILRFDKQIFKEKRTKFSSKFKKSGNIAGAYINDKKEDLYIAHSSLSENSKGYKGEHYLVLKKEHPKYKYIDVIKNNGEKRVSTDDDTEAKLFEFFADHCEEKGIKTITMLSERGMCDSCKGVMEQFKQEYPNIKVNVISNKRVEGDVWKHREEVDLQ